MVMITDGDPPSLTMSRILFDVRRGRIYNAVERSPKPMDEFFQTSFGLPMWATLTSSYEGEEGRSIKEIAELLVGGAASFVSPSCDSGLMVVRQPVVVVISYVRITCSLDSHDA
jgi:hypothetical protein